MAERYDAIVVGTGQSGPSLAARLAGAGQKVAIVERKRFGGTCVNNGCTPTKTLVASARAAHMARRGADFGVVIDGPIRVDMAKVKARKDAVVAKSSGGVERWLKGLDNATVYEGHGSFEGPRTVRVGEALLEAERVFINVGARAALPAVPGIEGVPTLDNVSVMELDFLPAHLVVLGGGYIGLEFAQIFRRFGAEVTVIHRGPRLLSREDEDVAEAVRGILEAEGIEVFTDTADWRVEGADGAISLTMQCRGEATKLAGSHLLVATGRVPNTGDLGLDNAGIEADGRGFIKVDDQLRTSAPGVWAMGDCNGLAAFTHTSYNDFEIIAGNLLDGDRRRTGDRIPIYAVFIDPPLGRVGMTEREVRESGREALIARRPMTRVSRAVERDETQGFMKVLVDAESKQILGAALLGIGCDEVVQSLADMMYAKAPYTVVQRAMHIHPTVTELIPTMLGELAPLG